MTGLIILCCACGFFLAGRVGIFIAFFIATVMNLGTYWFSDKVVLKMYKAKEVTANENSRLYRIVKNITTTSMIPMPKVYIVPSKAPNAFATGRDKDHAAVACTEGILEILNDAELEGVIGHELAHIQNKDMLIGTIAATFAGAIGILASMARWGAIFGGYSRDDNRGGGIVGLIVAAVIAPMIAMVIQMAISRQREFKADAEGAKMTNRYNELASALKKLHSAPIRMNLDNSPATAHLMIANPFSKKKLKSMFSTHPPVEERVKRLKELSEQSLYQGYANIG